LLLSICIPIYNQDVGILVSRLLSQIENKKNEVEILLIDDCSEPHFKDLNKVLSDRVSYIELDRNLGRSKVRNQFLKHSNSEYLLFIDCDSAIISEDYISLYLDYIKQNKPKVLVGASVYNEGFPGLNFRLRWKYGRKRESQEVEARRMNPSASFKTNNFLIARKNLNEIQFREELDGYGHEDTLFGYDLNTNSIEIEHIDNPVLNCQLDSNKEFLEKTEHGLHNLLKVWSMVNEDQRILDQIKILKFYIKYKDSKSVRLFYLFFRRPSRALLKMGWVNLNVFDFYKLGYLIELSSKT
jgi:glycosyltransferase involved in cell wall biosynthesis